MTPRIETTIPLVGYRVVVGTLVVQIECCAGGAPRVHLERGRLSFEEWTALRARVDTILGEIAIACTCGHPFSEHAADSPHACCSSVDHKIAGRTACGCQSFSAAAPIWERA